jgi:hypothetical protein
LSPQASKGCDAAESHPEAAPVPINPPSADCAVAAASAAKAASAVTKRIAAHRLVIRITQRFVQISEDRMLRLRELWRSLSLA